MTMISYSHRGRGPKNYTRSDDRIRDDVNDRFTDDHDLDASNVNVTVKGSEATLDGYVDSRRSKRRAEDIAHDISGVTHVQNNLRVRDLDDVDDDDVKTYPDDPDADQPRDHRLEHAQKGQELICASVRRMKGLAGGGPLFLVRVRRSLLVTRGSCHHRRFEFAIR